MTVFDTAIVNRPARNCRVEGWSDRPRHFVAGPTKEFRVNISKKQYLGAMTFAISVSTFTALAAPATKPSVPAPGVANAAGAAAVDSVQPQADHSANYGTNSGSNAADRAGNDSFVHYDTNGDGKLSLAEAGSNSAMTKRFASIDTNHDGSVSKEEFDAAGAAPGALDTQRPANTPTTTAPATKSH